MGVIIKKYNNLHINIIFIDMKKILVAISLVVILATVSSCKEKRCACTYIRMGYPESHSLEPMGPEGCVDTLEYLASDSISFIKKLCVEEE